MKDNSKIIVILLAIVAIIVVIISTFFGKKSEEREINIVKNYSNFYTVNSCLYRMITYISSSDKESLILLLDNDYKTKNKINADNVMNLFENIGLNSTFISKKMYYEVLNKNITKYYVYGIIQEEGLYEDIKALETKNAYFIVYLDSNNKTFSVEPYSGEIFVSGGSNE